MTRKVDHVIDSRSSSPASADEELRLPRTPGLIRRFWARHPLLADVLIMLMCLLFSPITTSGLNIFIGDAGSLNEGLLSDEPMRPPVAAVVLMLAIAACLLVLRRRRWPVALLLAAYALSYVSLLLYSPSSGLVLIVAAYGVAVYRSTRAAWTLFGIGTGAYAAICLIVWFARSPTFDDLSFTFAGFVVTALIGTLIGANVGGRKRYVEAIIDRSRQLLFERDQQSQIAAASERARIAREMHDIVSHSLTVVVALSEGAAATEDRQRARDASTAAAATARSALKEMRGMLGVLRDGDADAPLAPGEPVDPEHTVREAQRAGYPATLTTTGTAVLPPAARFAIGRIVQEGMTNAMRHSRGATMIAVRISYGEDAVTIEVENDGARTATVGAGFGIRGLQERAAHVGGELVSAPTGTARWLLRAELPAAGEEPND